MPSNIRVGENESAIGTSGLRINALNAGGKELSRPEVAISNKARAGLLPEEGVQEVFFDMTHADLERFVNDRSAADEFVARRTFSLDKPRIRLFAVRLSLDSTNHPSRENLQVLTDILRHPKNDVLLPPVVHFVGAAEDAPRRAKISCYLRVLEQFLELISDVQSGACGITIPHFLTRREVDLNELWTRFDKTGRHPQFILLDLRGKRVQNGYLRILPVLRKAREWHPEGSFYVYLFDVTAAKKSAESQPSEEILGILGLGVNGVGPRRGKPLAITQVPSDSPFSTLPKAVDTESLYYRRMDYALGDSVSAWVEDKIGRPRPSDSLKAADVHAFNIVTLDAELKTLAGAARDGALQEFNNALASRRINSDVSAVNGWRKGDQSQARLF